MGKNSEEIKDILGIDAKSELVHINDLMVLHD